MKKKTVLQFGKYYMDLDGKQKGDISWIVLHKTDESMLLISEKILDYELVLNDDKSYTQATISEQYRTLIENFSDEE